MTKDLTTGKPSKLIFAFALPTLLGILFQQFYSLVDTMIVGKLLDTSALAAVGSTGSLNFMVIGFVNGVGSGFAIPVAQQMGAGHHSLMRKYVANAFWLSGVFALALTLLTTLFCRSILLAMQTPEDIFQGAYGYIFMIFCGIPATFLYNLLSSIIRALGDSKTPVYFLGLASLLNIALDYALIAWTPLGVTGAALATVISQGFSGVACLFYLRKKFTILRMESEEKKLDSSICKNLCYMGIPMGLQFSITALGTVVLQTAVNGLGSVAVGAISTASKVSIFFWAPFEALGITMATYCGQNVGAMKLNRLWQGMKAGILMGSIYAVVAYGVVLLFSRPLLMLFLNPQEENVQAFLDMASQNMLICNAGMLFLCVLQVTRFSIQGMGFSNFAMLAGVMEMVARIAVAYWMVPALGFVGACYGGPIAWVAALLFLIPASALCINKLKRVHHYEPPETATD